ncbi:unnamed protein product [Kuraishia capsulata CBS 1993]|uniref:Septin-type G domain-containing protein n=1 Tax=Kuraishia capsulata CBS 1993 TaxID=1382522 RepID=W6MP11_9ASCO|nr:uncharacterized protein KUCA_T00002781001 [Kuraishia capsulata CBS 1993]CDK26807.1 unnamed protein product [Kuraishia capsulata CBS 1993]
MMVCGETGTGKSTFVKMLCGENCFGEDPLPEFKPGMDPQVSIRTFNALVMEEETPINLDVVMVPGFGDKVDNRRCSGIVLDYLNNQLNSVLNEECRIQRNSMVKDGRVHVLLYFIRPTGKGLRQLDINFMKLVGPRCNLIPVLSKADVMSSAELITNKKKVMADITANNIEIYDFGPWIEDANEGELPEFLKVLPFAVMSSTEKREVDGKEQYVREYPWGTAIPEDVTHSDYLMLKILLLGTCLQDLKDTTVNVIYERFRTERLSSKVNIRSASSAKVMNALIDRVT